MTVTTEHTTRRETPTATLVLSVDAPRAEWLDARRGGITATDLPAILGMSQYRTAIDVWNDKIMPVTDDATLNEAAVWGMRLEEPVAQEWADRHNVRVRRIGLVSNDERPWMLASLDRIVHGCPDGRCALEVKTRSLFVSDAWDKALPDDVRTQVMWQLAVTGLDHIHVAALIGGQRMVEHVVHPNPARITELIDAAEIIWDAARTGELPDLPAHMWTADYVEARHPNRAGSIELGKTARALISDYQMAAGLEREYADRKAALRTQLVGLLGESETATIDDAPAYTYKATTRTTLDAKKVAEKYPHVTDDQSVHTTTSSRTLRITLKETL